MAKRSVRWQGGLPRRRPRQPGKAGRKRGDWLDGLEFFDLGENPLAALVAIVVLLLVGLLLWFTVVPLILAIVDLTILILLTLAGLAARVVLRRPWEIEAVGPNGHRLTWRVVGWQRSRRAITAVADRLARGQIPPTDSPDFPPR